jgi:Family of unknown function (DUF5989)
VQEPREISMSEMQEATKTGGAWEFLWKRKTWWLWPLIVLVFLLGAIYVLVHLSASDPETYPTSSRTASSYTRLC